MSSPSPPKPQKINPYEGVGSDRRVNEARQALGMDNIEDEDDMRKVNDYIFNQDVAHYQKDPEFNKAVSQLVMEGRIDADVNRYSDEESYNKWADSKGFDEARKKHYAGRMVKEHGEDWYHTGIEGAKINTQNIVDIQGRQEENYYNDQSAEQQAQLDKAYKRSKRDSKKAADEQRAFMEEMMNQPVYMAKQAALPTVQKPVAKQDPILPAPAAPNPMNIAPPPAPELTAAANKMAIVKTPQSTKARQRRATRGTSSLTN